MTINNTTFQLKYFFDEDGVKYWDVDLDDNKNISLISGVESVAQTVKNALYLWMGEYDFDITLGINWPEILGNIVNKSDLNSRITSAVLSVSYVTRVVSINYEISENGRSISINLIYLNADNSQESINVNI